MNWSDEQKDVLRSQGNTLVSASAGSGKTTILIEKILRLLEEGQDLRRILVMTFSRAAAQDMKTKLVEKIHARLSFGSETETLRKQLENVPFSNICTINSFCYTLMKRYFTAVDADPSCSILDEEEEKQLLDECLDRAIERLIEKGEENFLKTLEYFSQGRKRDGIKKVVLSLRSFLCAQEKPEEFLKNAEQNGEKAESCYFSFAKKKVEKLSERGRILLRMKEEEGVTEKEEQYRDIVLRLQRAGTQDLKNYFTELSGVVVPVSFDKRWVEKGKITEEFLRESTLFLHAVSALKKRAEQDRELFERPAPKSFVVDALIALYEENEREYTFRKKQRSVIDFTDAERKALEILKQESFREEIRNKYDYVFIDEYQDTNYLQEALLEGVSKGDNLFAVGDVKQAIYLFRHAEPKIFNDRKRMYESVAGAGNNCLLNDNYRSCEGVLDFTNRVLSRVMTEDFGGVSYAEDAMLRSGLKIKGAEDAVRVYTYKKEDDRPPAEQGNIYRVKTAPKKVQSDREALFVAEEIVRLIEKGRKYEDIAVLTRANRSLENIANALQQKGIPYYVAKEQKTILTERETLIDCLRLLLNDNDDISLIHVLSGEWMDFSPQELMDIRLFSPKTSFSEAFRAYEGNEELEKKRDDFLRRTERWRFDSTYLPVAELLRNILKEGYDAVLLKNRETIVQINAFLLYVEKQAEKMSLSEFIRYYDEIYSGNPPPMASSAVTLMTLHGSKGLEFPVVFMPYVSKSFINNDDKRALMCDRDLGIAIKQFDEEGHQTKTNFPLRVFEMKKDAEEREGELRLTYVAFTRAKEELILSGEEKQFDGEGEDATCIMDWLLLTQRKDGSFARYFRPMPESQQKAYVRPPAHSMELDLSCLEKRYPYEEATRMHAKTSVSDILERDGNVGVRILPKEDGPSAAAIGTAMHTVLRYIDFSADTPEKAKMEINKMVAEGLLTEEERELVDHIKISELLRMPVLLEIKNYPMHREYPFIAYYCPEQKCDDKVLVQGVIDLLVELPDGTFMLIDYKMSVLGAENMKKRYSEQIELYKRAVESILHRPVSRRYLINIERGFCVSL